MKKSIFYAFILAASVWAAGCGKAKQPLELVTDQYGVAYKVNPSEKKRLSGVYRTLQHG